MPLDQHTRDFRKFAIFSTPFMEYTSQKKGFAMITLFLLGIIIFLFICMVLGIGGTILIIFGDLIVAVLVIYAIVKLIQNLRS